MSSGMISARASAKSILAGEHAVIRGGPALVVPVYHCELVVTFRPGPKFKIFFEGAIPIQAQIFFEGVLERALQQCGKNHSDFLGELVFSSTIPIGSGLGSSAALCVSLASVFQTLGWIGARDLFSFSRSLEDLFHGTSSGVDVAACIENAPIRFQKNLETSLVPQWTRLKIRWQPCFYISFCGTRGITSECVQHVQKIWDRDAKYAAAADALMIGSVEKIQNALTMEASANSMIEMVEGLHLGHRAFEQWDLINKPLRDHMKQLMQAGALAVKPTGSGGGGYVLSLWQESQLLEIPQALKALLIPVPLLDQRLEV